MRPPAIVLMPGMDGTGNLFGPLLSALPDELDTAVVRYPNDALSIADCARAALDQLPGENAVVLVAESFSGPVVPLLEERQDQVAGVVFCATFLTPPRPLLLKLARFLPLAALMPLAPLGVAARVCMGRRVAPELMELFRTTVHSVPPATHAARLRELGRIDSTGRLGWLADRPALYLRASHDRLVPESAIEPFREHLSRLEVHSVEGHHFLLQSNPRGCARLVCELVAGIR